MKIAIDAREAVGQPAGKGKVVAKLLPALLAADAENQYYIFLKSDLETALPANAQKIFITAPSLLWHFAAARRAKKLGVDVYLAPTSFIVPAISKIPSVIVVHDLVALMKIAYHQRKARFVEGATLKRAVRNAKAIIAVSKHTAQDLAQRWPDSAAKTTVVYSGSPLDGIVINSDAQAVRKAYHLPERFILFVGTLEPRKNPEGILKGYAHYRDLVGASNALPLIMVGKRGWHAQDFFDLVEALNLHEAVRFVDYVSSEDLYQLYKLADCFLFPSLYEGFGLIVLEALQLGCPVITSHVSSLPEVGGDAARYVDPKDPRDIAKALRDVTTDRAYAAQMRQKGRAYAAQFTWAKTAAGYKEVLHKVHAHKS